MVVLDVKKPEKRSKAHFKAIIYSHLLKEGFDVYIDVNSNSLVKYTKDIKGYQKIRFDIVVFLDIKPILIINFGATTRRKTKTSFYGIPAINVDLKKFNKKAIYKEAIQLMSQ